MITGSRRTKIVCTLGPSSNTLEKIEKLFLAGMNVARINFSHGSHEDHARTISYVRKVAKKHKYAIPVLMDLQGPKIRVGKMKEGSQILRTGSKVTITPEDVQGTSELIPIDYSSLTSDAEPGHRIMVDDGLLELQVISVNEREVFAKVIVGGVIKSRKGVNLPGIKISMPSLTDKDIEDLEFGLTQEVDFVAMSFVRSARDIQDVISRIRAGGSNAGLIAKIEKPEAVDVIDAGGGAHHLDRAAAQTAEQRPQRVGADEVQHVVRLGLDHLEQAVEAALGMLLHPELRQQRIAGRLVGDDDRRTVARYHRRRHRIIR
jgi:pyruvate kinase